MLKITYFFLKIWETYPGSCQAESRRRKSSRNDHSSWDAGRCASRGIQTLVCASLRIDQCYWAITVTCSARCGFHYVSRLSTWRHAQEVFEEMVFHCGDWRFRFEEILEHGEWAIGVERWRSTIRWTFHGECPGHFEGENWFLLPPKMSIQQSHPVQHYY